MSWNDTSLIMNVRECVENPSETSHGTWNQRCVTERWRCSGASVSREEENHAERKKKACSFEEFANNALNVNIDSCEITQASRLSASDLTLARAARKLSLPPDVVIIVILWISERSSRRKAWSKLKQSGMRIIEVVQLTRVRFRPLSSSTCLT